MGVKAKKLVALTVPFMLLVGCGVGKTEAKPKESVEEKVTKKKKVSGDEYPEVITSISSDFLKKVADLSETARDRTMSDEEVSKTMLSQIKDIQKTIKKFEEIEPPVEFRKPHETLLEAVASYKDAYKTQENMLKPSKDVKPEQAQKVKDKLKEASELWAIGFKPIEEDITSRAKVIGDKVEKRTAYEQAGNKEIDVTGKELLGDWGTYTDQVYHTSFRLREDGTFTIFDDSGKSSYEQNHMTGTWYYSKNKNQVTLIPKEFVKDGKVLDPSQMKVAVDYDVLKFTDEDLVMVDQSKSNRIEVKRHKQ